MVFDSIPPWNIVLKTCKIVNVIIEQTGCQSTAIAVYNKQYVSILGLGTFGNFKLLTKSNHFSYFILNVSTKSNECFQMFHQTYLQYMIPPTWTVLLVHI